MTLAEFFGCTCLAFGPPFTMFVFTIAHDPIRIIILVAAAFFWLVSLLLSSIVWVALIPIKTYLQFAIFYTVLFQEIFRFAIYKILRRAEYGLKKITENSTTLTENKHILAYVSGLGFGIMSGAFSLINILADAVGPGTMGLKAGKETFFLTSSAIGLCFILLNTFWSVIFFNACDNRNYINLGYVILSHLLASYLTLLNSQYNYWECITTLYILMIFTGCFALKIAGGTIHSLTNGLKFKATI
ncbi:gamma-secretase subunit Aph-1 [Diorhabda carinulata]|uniref:gamma-secretase subunit Aph-1 n=1 Tax=Diorhabda carinulata TaxID=1163345 RepID=UPI0025A27418|nr:gamma-secretase subunit Aph-1 [Diorhabda carinulata]